MTLGPSPTRRRVLAAAGTLLLPPAARAQPAKHRRIAFLDSRSRTTAEPYLEAFRQELRALGYGDDDIAIESRSADGQVEHLPSLAAELVRLDPEVIVVVTPPAIQTVRQATPTIPIVMIASGDPVAGGFVASLAHPGGNVTGLANLSPEMAGKLLDLLKIAIPIVDRVAILLNPGNSQHLPMLQVARQAARTLRIELVPVEAGARGEIDDAFAAMARRQAEAVIIPNDTVFVSERSRLVELAASHKLPAIYQFRGFTAIGGLMSYGPDPNEGLPRAAAYVDKILKGAKPADLPVEQPTRFLLVVNLKTARVLGLTIPSSILAGADEVIE
jgi:putative ABC transport system substrate-binding protein